MQTIDSFNTTENDTGTGFVKRRRSKLSQFFQKLVKQKPLEITKNSLKKLQVQKNSIKNQIQKLQLELKALREKNIEYCKEIMKTIKLRMSTNLTILIDCKFFKNKEQSNIYIKKLLQNYSQLENQSNLYKKCFQKIDHQLKLYNQGISSIQTEKQKNFELNYLEIDQMKNQIYELQKSINNYNSNNNQLETQIKVMQQHITQTENSMMNKATYIQQLKASLKKQQEKLRIIEEQKMKLIEPKQLSQLSNKKIIEMENYCCQLLIKSKKLQNQNLLLDIDVKQIDLKSKTNKLIN